MMRNKKRLKHLRYFHTPIKRLKEGKMKQRANITPVFAGFLFISILLFPMFLSATLDPMEIVRKGDEVVNAPKDAYIRSKMELIDSKGFRNVRESEMYQKGKDKRLVRFLSPADQKGIAFLSLPNDVMYLYLPAFHKIRKIAPHVKNQKFAGTDLTYDDLSAFELAKAHRAELVEEKENHYVIKLIPNDPTGKEYAYLHVWYRKDNFYPVKTEYYDENGNLIKILERRKLKLIDGYWISMELYVKDLKTNHITHSYIEEVKLDIGLQDSIFTRRTLVQVR